MNELPPSPSTFQTSHPAVMTPLRIAPAPSFWTAVWESANQRLQTLWTLFLSLPWMETLWRSTQAWIQAYEIRNFELAFYTGITVVHLLVHKNTYIVGIVTGRIFIWELLEVATNKWSLSKLCKMVWSLAAYGTYICSLRLDVDLPVYKAILYFIALGSLLLKLYCKKLSWYGEPMKKKKTESREDGQPSSPSDHELTATLGILRTVVFSSIVRRTRDVLGKNPRFKRAICGICLLVIILLACLLFDMGKYVDKMASYRGVDSRAPLTDDIAKWLDDMSFTQSPGCGDLEDKYVCLVQDGVKARVQDCVKIGTDQHGDCRLQRKITLI